MRTTIHQPALSTIRMVEQKINKKNISDPRISYFKVFIEKLSLLYIVTVTFCPC
jgi:hypothetical protein